RTDEWANRPISESPQPASVSENLGQAIRAAAAFNVRTFGAVASWALTFGRDRAEKGLTAAIAGDHSGVRVTLGTTPAVAYARAKQRLRQETDTLERQLQM